MRVTKFLLPCFVLSSLLMVLTDKVDAKPEYSKTEKTSCVTCHVSAKSKDLNDKGKYYKEHKKLPAK